jgi:phosphoribosylaminoimidazole-succinocarboxamide synthase
MNNKFERGDLIYEGKAKKVFEVVNEPGFVWLEFKDSLTAFNAQKKGSFQGKGELNRDIASLVFRYLRYRGLQSHWITDYDKNAMVVMRLKMLPLEVVVRNIAAGSLAKKFSIDEGKTLKEPLIELYFKNDELQDPFISDDQALMFGLVSSQAQLETVKHHALSINAYLKDFFDVVKINLVDFKIEFGLNFMGDALLADEITPDSCRLWDAETGEKLDKDRFRRDLGDIDKAYKNVLERLKTRWENLV